jgi:hypothetical protein
MFEPGQVVAITMLDSDREQVIKYNLEVLKYDNGLLKVLRPGQGAETQETVYNLHSLSIISVEVMKGR